MLKKLFFLFNCVAFAITTLSAQDQVVYNGKVVDPDGNPISGATVTMPSTGQTSITDALGSFSLAAPSYGKEIVISSAEFAEQTIVFRSSELVTIYLGSIDQSLDEVVVTGVSDGINKRKLGFSVSKVSERLLQQVPAVDPGNALRGKVAGVRIVQPSGNPGTEPSIRFRGSKSISGLQAPLYLLDGIITAGGRLVQGGQGVSLTAGGLSDFGTGSIRSMEVVKGAAASSLYGSLAGNGVLQIISKRGASKRGVTEVEVRIDAGFSGLANRYPLANKHFYKTDPSQPSGLATDAGGNRIPDVDKGYVNDYAINNDNIKNAYKSNPFNIIYASVASSEEKFNYHASFERNVQGGVLEGLDPYKKWITRLNFDVNPTDRLKIKTTTLYANSEGTTVSEQGQGEQNVFYAVLTAEPFINLKEKDPATGLYAYRPTYYKLQGSNFQNPLYLAQIIDFTSKRQRFLFGAELKYTLTDWLYIKGNYSIDKYDVTSEVLIPKEFEDPNPGSNDGSLVYAAVTGGVESYSLSLQGSKSFGDLNTRYAFRYLFEDWRFDYSLISGTNFTIEGVRNPAYLANRNSPVITSEPQRAENFFFDVSADYQDKIIAGGLIRRDGSSLFGDKNRFALYGRGFLAYRLTEDIDIPGVQELKLRASYGISGQRPPWAAQYETYSANSEGQPTPNTIGNNEIKPSTIKEWEFGLDLEFLDRLEFNTNIVFTTIDNDIILVPQNAAVTNFPYKYKNAASLSNFVVEASLTGNVIETQDFNWNIAFNFDVVRQRISSLDVAAYTRSISNTAVNIFRVESNVQYGAMYGSKIATSLDELTVVNGVVLNSHPTKTNPTINDFEINSDGYVVPAGSQGTKDEQVVYLVDNNKERLITQIGNTNPDFNLGFASTVSWKGLALYFVLDYQHGGDIYNYTKQLLYFNNRHKDLQDYSAKGKHALYANGNSNIYNAGNPSSYFVEDGTFLKVREISLGYDIDQSILDKIFFGFVKGVNIAIRGRNLFTFTKYSGWDPEVAISVNPTNFRLDEYSYPNFRTFSGSLTFKF